MHSSNHPEHYRKYLLYLCTEKHVCTILYVLFWVFPRRLIFVCQCFGTLYLFHLHMLDMKHKVWSILHTSYPAYEDGTDRVFRNVGIQQSDAVEIPKVIHKRFKTRRKFETENSYALHHSAFLTGTHRLLVTNMWGLSFQLRSSTENSPVSICRGSVCLQNVSNY